MNKEKRKAKDDVDLKGKIGQSDILFQIKTISSFSQAIDQECKQ